MKWHPVLQTGLTGYRIYYGVAGVDPNLQGNFALEGPSGITVPPGATSFTLHCNPHARVAIAVRAIGPGGRESLASDVVAATPLSTVGAEDVPTAFALGAPRPNPARQGCDITLELPKAVPVRLEVFDVRGRSVARLVDANLPAGRHAVRWHAEGASTGLYFIRVKAGVFSESRRIVLTR